MRMWASLREKYGIYGDSSHPVGRLLSAQPDLRGLIPSELAARLGIEVRHAQDGIIALAVECFPPGTDFRVGESFDSLTILAGRPAAPVELVTVQTPDGERTATRPSGVILSPVLSF